MAKPSRDDRCRFCGCSELDACVVDDWIELVGCSWTDRTKTVCSVCAPAAKAETIALKRLMRAGYRSPRPGIRDAVTFVDAFHRGFVVGWFAISARSPYGRNPFRSGWRLRAEVFDAWELGHRAGVEASRSYQRVCGPLQNTPRRTVLRRSA